MAKRRRERDRPKSGPEESAYNPHKRILLSYGDEDDEEEQLEIPDVIQPAAGGRAVMDDAQLTNYQIEEYPDDEDEDETGPGAEEEEYVPEDVPTHRGEIRKNQATNMYPALGAASFQWEEGDGYEEEEEDSETRDAMAYLKAVRSERQKMPEILGVKANPEDYDDEWDPEEAYIGSPTVNATPAEDLSNPQVAFTKALVQKFIDHRTLLHQPATLEALEALSDNQPISFPRGNNKAYTEWHRILSSKASQSAQVRSLQQETVFDLLALIQKHFLAKGKNVKKVTSSWIWSLLARLDDVGSMTNDDVYPLREFGKRAVFVQYSITSPEIAEQLEAIGQAGMSDSQVEDGEIDLEDVADAEGGAEPPEVKEKGTKPNSLPESQVTDNTKATLDMILVIVGEVFGQRDLLEFRQKWTAADISE